MGGILCCIRQPITDEKQAHDHEVEDNVLQESLDAAAADKKLFRKPMNSSELKVSKVVEWRTLEECFLASPNLNAYHHHPPQGQEVQIFKNLPKKVHPSSSPDDDDISQEFFTPRRSFSPAETLGKIDEGDEEEEQGRENSASTTPSSSFRTGSRSGKLRKKVSFKLPGEADIFVYYTPKTTFDEP